jgi:hypothetical protein
MGWTLPVDGTGGVFLHLQKRNPLMRSEQQPWDFYCPLKDFANCRGAKCAWFDSSIRRCVIMGISTIASACSDIMEPKITPDIKEPSLPTVHYCDGCDYHTVYNVFPEDSAHFCEKYKRACDFTVDGHATTLNICLQEQGYHL